LIGDIDAEIVTVWGNIHLEEAELISQRVGLFHSLILDFTFPLATSFTSSTKQFSSHRRLGAMPAKRKAPPGRGPAAKRIASAASTPRNDDDDYLDEEGMSAEEDDHDMEALVNKFSISQKRDKTYSRNDTVSELFRGRDHSNLPLKPDHEARPLWIDPNKGRIIVESFSPRFKSAESFLINIAEPQSRVSLIHEYTLTPHSLFAAVSVGLSTEDIIRDLEGYSKTPLPQTIIDYIRRSTGSFGKVRLVLKHNKYWVESNDPTVLQKLLHDSEISKLRAAGSVSAELTTAAAPKMGDLVIAGTKMAAGAKQAIVANQHREVEEEVPADTEQMQNALLEDEDDEQPEQVHSFEVPPVSVEAISKRCKDMDLPLTEEYDFRNDTTNANLEIDLNPAAQIRPYQEQALHKMFGNGRARSGIIVLPCGAGKTLVGITAACTVKKGIIVLCTSAMSVVQWKKEFRKWSNCPEEAIATFTADSKGKFGTNTGIIISTYSMMTQNKNRAHDSQQVMDFIEQREWGLMILDEVHVVPADMFKKVTYRVKAHSKLGLTATLLREAALRYSE